MTTSEKQLLKEHELRAYINGNTGIARLLGKLIDLSARHNQNETFSQYDTE